VAEGPVLTDEIVEPALFVSPESENETKRVIVLSEYQLRCHLRDLIAAAKKRKEHKKFIADFANDWGVSPQYLGQFLAGRRGPGRAILKAIGAQVETVKVYHLPVYEGDPNDE
jgi:hypothetical protein